MTQNTYIEVMKERLDECVQTERYEMAAKLTNNGEKAATLGDKFKILGAGMKSAFSNLSKNRNK